MDKHFIVVRHSTPEVDHAIPSHQWNLSETGTRRAQLLAEKLSSFPVELVVSSPEPKALETATIIASKHSLIPLVQPGLHEHDRSHIPFITESDFRKAMFSLFENPDRLKFGSETAVEAKERFEETIKELLEDHPGGDIVIVSHGTVMALFIAKQLNIEPYKIWQDMSMPIAYVFSRPQLLVEKIIRVD